jgi:hypothetical protein
MWPLTPGRDFGRPTRSAGCASSTPAAMAQLLDEPLHRLQRVLA